MESNPKSYRRGHWIVWGTILGAFLGVIFGKFALGLIFGFFVGVFVDSAKWKASRRAEPPVVVEPGKE